MKDNDLVVLLMKGKFVKTSLKSTFVITENTNIHVHHKH